jgi:hypothetical protein
MIDYNVMTVRQPHPIGVRLTLAILWAITIIVALTNCNPQEEINRYFADRGLNPLAIMRDDIQPGGLILKGRKGAIYAGQMLDYGINLPPSLMPSVATEPSTEVFHSVFDEYKGEKSLSAEAAVAFLYGLFQFEPSAAFDFQGRVHIKINDSSFETMNVSEIQRYLGSPAAKPFVDLVLEAIDDKENDDKEKAFLAYEVHRATSLRISSAESKDVTPSLAVGTVGQVPLKGKGRLRYAKRSTSEMILEVERPYAFAVRTAELIKHPLSTRSLSLRLTKFLDPETVKAVGTDQEYSAAINEGFAPVVLDGAVAPLSKP